MKNSLLALFLLFSTAFGFAPLAPLRTSTSLSAVEVNQQNIGVLRPFNGIYDPLNLMADGDAAFRRRRISEIKHGRVAMMAVIGNLAPQLGLTFPGYLSTSEKVLFSDVATGNSFTALTKIPLFGVFQILAFAGLMECWTWKQEKNAAPGDVGGDDWVRYQDVAVKEEKLTKELQNGRLAMLAIFGLMVQEQLNGKGAIEMLGF
ncbi:hypothetical protein TrLO_g11927 [Triparma laevis f. longispina]|uniref:Uncharacterized protein n=1 Tax=Triparma laevis f. longispina TaxID=1714387 RepID=A0A9W7FQK1_9STRA|nr:hypothetical protein TrLO_g11927 [Triparma laevis f. longispina]